MNARCPHCSHVFPTTITGEQRCPACGGTVHVPAAVGLGTPVDARRSTPWERRKELGFVRAFWTQWKETVLRPTDFYNSVRPDGPWEDALLFGWLNWGIGALVGLPFAWMLFSSLPPAPTLTNLSPAGSSSQYSSFGFLGAAVLYPVHSVMVAAAVHLGCLALGCAKNGFLATFRATSYSTSMVVFSGIPCVNAITLFYMIFQQVKALASLQETTWPRALVAMLLLSVVVCCCIGVAVAGVVLSMNKAGFGLH